VSGPKASEAADSLSSHPSLSHPKGRERVRGRERGSSRQRPYGAPSGWPFDGRPEEGDQGLEAVSDAFAHLIIWEKERRKTSSPLSHIRSGERKEEIRGCRIF
jgi:hypothetical protein